MLKEEYEKLRWRCIRRGLLELDIALTKFLEEDFPKLSEEQVKAFVALTELEDPDLWALISGAQQIADPRLAEIVSLLRKNDVRASH
jgi:succinate dehydrogenase flavin-adding protein (antitoxin of CptAB toxin-antitoxin module)